MTVHCAVGDEPWVYYRFAGGAWQKIQIKAAPIDVTVVDELSRNLFKGVITNSQVLRIPANQSRVSIALVKSTPSILVCYRREEQANKEWAFLGSSPQILSYKGLLSIYAFNFNTTATVEVAENLSGGGGKELKIHYQGSLMFNKLGKSPCEFKVACADCPPGFLKCERPGSYYCMPVSEVRPALVYIQSLLRNQNG